MSDIRTCRRCKEEFSAEHNLQRICTDCRGPRDLVDELNGNEAGRLARGLRQMNNAGR